MNIDQIIETIEDLSWQHFRPGDDESKRQAYRVSLLESKMREMWWENQRFISELRLEIVRLKKGLDNGHADRF